MKEPIGFIGLGNMGKPMATHLLNAGYPLTVFDTREEAVSALVDCGAKAAISAEATASEAETVIMSLPTPEIVKDVALGPNGIILGSKVKTLVDLSTTGPRAAQNLSARLAIKGINFVDSPVSGGISGAEKGTLAVMLSCPDQQITWLRNLLGNIGNVFHVGTEPGLGQSMKLANNLLSAAALAITSEAMVMGVKAGLDPNIMLEVINAGSGKNTATQDKFPKAVLTRSFDRGFTNSLMHKDVELFLEEAQSLKVPTSVASAVQKLWQTACSEIGPGADFTTIVQCVENRAGVEVKGT